MVVARQTLYLMIDTNLIFAVRLRAVVLAVSEGLVGAGVLEICESKGTLFEGVFF